MIRGYIDRETKARLIADLPHHRNAELALKYGLSPSIVAWHRRKTGLFCPVRGISRDVKSRVIRLRTANISISRIIAETGLKEHTVRRILYESGGFDINDPGPRPEITPENCEPACYDEMPEPSFEWESVVNDFNPNTPDYNPDYGRECRERYEELRRWKSAKAKQLAGKGRNRQ